MTTRYDMAYPRWTVMTERRRLTLRGGRPRLEHVLLTEQTNPIDVGAWLEEYHLGARTRGRFVPYIILEQLAAGIAPVTVTDPTELIHLSREAHDPYIAHPRLRARPHCSDDHITDRSGRLIETFQIGPDGSAAVCAAEAHLLDRAIREIQSKRTQKPR
jgi:hypothetical protein